MTSEQTLVLDVGMQPIRIVNWQEAIVWCFERIVDVIDTHPRKIGTPNPKWQVEVPSIVKFVRPLPKKRAIKFSRHGVYARDMQACQYCGQRVARAEFTYDHVIPRAMGGKTSWENVVVACVRCNQWKGGRTPEQAGMRLRSMPVKPKRLPDFRGFMIQFREGMPESWRDYLRDAVYWGGELEE